MKLNTVRRRASALAVGFVLFLSFSTPAAMAKEGGMRAGQLSVMTQNLYVGAEVLGVAAAPGLCELMSAADFAVQQVLANDFSQRADALAALIAAENPDVVGLQEAFRVVLSDLGGTPFYFDDYLDMLLSALNNQGVSYYAAAIRASTPINVPADSDGDCDPAAPSLGAADYVGTIVDHDVILCRDDVDCSNAASAIFQLNAGADTPAGPISIERGWVSVVVTLKGRSYRVVNTHLEVDSDASFRTVQFYQAGELGETLNAMLSDGLPQVVLGDFNSDDDPEPPVCLVADCYSGYQVMAAYGFSDAWLARGGKPEDGFTCCQDADLRNPESALSSRIDLVWVRGATGHYGGPALRGVRMDVVGDDPSDRSVADGLWPSDHAGVSAEMVLRTPL